MKKIIATIIAVAVPALFTAVSSRGEEATTSARVPTVEDSTLIARAEADQAQAEAKKMQAEAQQQYMLARQQMDQARVQVAQAESEYEPVRGFRGGTASSGSAAMPPPPGASTQFSERLTQIIQRGGSGPGRTLVVRSGDGDPGTQAAIEEDLAVMSHIFDKAIVEKVSGGNRERTAMGISVYFGPNADTIRNLYLDGYGALFTLKVNFPLLAPPKVSEEPKEKPAATSEWDEAKRELYSHDEGSSRTIPTRAMRLPPSSEAGEEYSEQKVTQLKDALLESLKSATNIRNLKPDDSITLCVFGGSSTAPAFYRTSSTGRAVPVGPGAAGVTAVAPPAVDPTTGLPLSAPASAFVSISRGGGLPGRGSILTIRVKKSDVDAFAKGKLDLEQFRKKASVTIYPGGGDGANVAQRWEMF